MRSKLATWIVVLAVAAHAAGSAAAPLLPTPQDVERARQDYRLPEPGRLDAATDQARRDTARALDRAGGAGAAIPKINFDRLPVPAQGVDVRALVDQYYTKNRAVFDPAESATRRNAQQGLLYFASLSIPAESLERSIAQAERLGAAIVLRGLTKTDDMKGTLEQIRDLIRGRAVSFMIDPVLFAKFEITHVPALVVLPGKTIPHCEDNACEDPPPLYWAVTGDVSLDYALEEIARAVPGADAVIQPYLRRFRGGD